MKYLLYCLFIILHIFVLNSQVWANQTPELIKYEHYGEKSYEEQHKGYNLLVMGNALYDKILKCDSDNDTNLILKEVGVLEGGYKEISKDQFEQFSNKCPVIKVSSGGSVANSLKIFVKLGGKGAIIGNIEKDKVGEAFIKDLKDIGANTFLNVKNLGKGTGEVCVFISQDGERTMLGYLGSALDFEINEINIDIFTEYKVLLTEAYLLDSNKGSIALKYAIKEAKNHSMYSALTLSSDDIVKKHKKNILEILQQIDIVFGNFAEFKELLNVDNIKQIIDKSQKELNISVVTLGSKGAIVITPNEVITIEPEKIIKKDKINTLGAGDAFAGAFLYGYINGYDLKSCGKLASKVAAQTIQTS